jgi:hypothetical protein
LSPPPCRKEMPRVATFHSVKPNTNNVYHDNSKCTKGNNIEKQYLRSGTANWARCDHCNRLAQQGGLILPVRSGKYDFPMRTSRKPIIHSIESRRNRTDKPRSFATASALNPSHVPRLNRIVGSENACPSPPSHDSNVSMPPDRSTNTYARIPSSSGMSVTGSNLVRKFIPTRSN